MNGTKTVTIKPKNADNNIKCFNPINSESFEEIRRPNIIPAENKTIAKAPVLGKSSRKNSTKLLLQKVKADSTPPPRKIAIPKIQNFLWEKTTLTSFQGETF